MKIIQTTLTAILSASAMAGELTQKEKEAFSEYYRSWKKLLERVPDRPEVYVMFVDLDGDGQEEAFASDQEERHEDGDDWVAFRKVGKAWQPIPFFNNFHQEVQDVGALFGRAGDFFRVVMHDGSVEFIALSESYDKREPDNLGPLYKIRFFMDKEGVLHERKIENLEKYLAYQGHQHSGLIRKLEAIPSEYFPGPGGKKPDIQSPASEPISPEKTKE